MWTEACSHDARDRISQCGGDDFTWDEDGRLVSREGAEGYVLTWDAEDRLLEVDYASGAVAEHGYDADGHRVWEVFTPNGESPETTEYLVDLVRDLAHDVADVQGGQVAARYVRAGDLLLGLVRGAEAKYFHADHLGSVRALTDEAGDVTDVYRYAPFGELRGHEGEDPQRYRFAGEKHGPEGRLSYNRARWMDPSLGVFGSIDPWAGRRGSPRTLHRYGYGAMDPISKHDPTGRFFTLSGLMVRTAILTHAVGSLLHAVYEGPSKGRASYHRVLALAKSDRSSLSAEVQRLLSTKLGGSARSSNFWADKYGDAIRHCTASCVVSAWYAGLPMGYAAGTMFEALLGWNWCDDHNNRVGSALGFDAIGTSECSELCESEANEGGLAIGCN